MTDRIAQMYGGKKASAPRPKPLATSPLEETTYIEQRKNVAVIKVGEQSVSVPTTAHIDEMVKTMTVIDRHIKQLTAENRRMRAFINKMAHNIKLIENDLDNKLDKL